MSMMIKILHDKMINQKKTKRGPESTFVVKRKGCGTAKALRAASICSLGPCLPPAGTQQNTHAFGLQACPQGLGDIQCPPVLLWDAPDRI